MTSAKQGRIITFYSYKGGTGRSMALANIAWILASNSKRVLAVDWDLEAPGLQRYFRPFLVDRELTSSPGVVDLITDFILEAITPLDEGEKLKPDWFLPRTDIDPYVISLNWKFPTGGQLDFIPAGRQGPDYGQRFSAINWQKFYDVLGGGAFIEQLKINMRSQYDYILVDSRTGVSDTSGICTIQMPDTLVVCFTFNNQSIEGAASVTQGVFEQRIVQDSNLSLAARDTPQASSTQVSDRFYQSPYRFKIFPVPMRVDQGEKDKLGVRQTYSRRKFDAFLDRKTVVDRRTFWGAVAVPYVPYFSYEEILATFKDDPSDPNTCLAAFIRIAAEITERDVTGFIPLISPEQREAILREFASVPLPELVYGTSGGTGSGTGSGTGTGTGEDSKIVSGRGITKVSTVNVGGTGSAAPAESQVESLLRRAEATFRSLNDAERDQARRLWMRLVRIPRPGENVENTKVRVPLKEIGAESTAVIQKFATAEVVTVSKDDGGEPTVEVQDEELLRTWPTLDSWIKGDRDLMIWRQDLQSSLAQWKERGKSWDDLLAGRRLWKAREWYKTHRKFLSDNEAAYIEASFQWSRRVILGIAAVVVVMLSVVYFLQTRSNKGKMAASIADDAESQIAAAKRQPQLAADQFQLGLLLALESQQLAATPKIETLLKNELALLPRRSPNVDVKSNVLDLAISPNGSQVLSVTGISPFGPGISLPGISLQEDRTAQLNDLSNGGVILRVPFKQGSRTFKLSPDARYLAVVSTQGNGYMVDVLEAATGHTVASLNHNDLVYDMAFSPDGNYFATAGGDKRARLVNLQQADRRSIELPYSGAVNAVSFSGDSRHLAIAGENFMVHVLRNLPSAVQFSDSREIKVGSTAFQIALSHDGRYLATVTLENKEVNLWDVETEKLLRKFYAEDAVYPMWFSHDDKLLLAAAGGTIHGWNLLSDGNRFINYDKYSRITFSEDGKYFGAFGNNVARIWKYDGSWFFETASLIRNSNLLRLSFGNDSAVTAGADNRITAWKLADLISDNLQYEACSRLTRNMTLEEWNTHVASYLGAYRQTCKDLP